MAIEYFCCYHSYLKKCEKLTDQEVGRLFRALLLYSITGNRQELDGRESIAFDFIADDIDRSKENYKNRCEKNAENGKKGGRPKKQTLSKKANGFLESEKSQSKYKYKYKYEEENNIPPIVPHKGGRSGTSPKYKPDWFDRFWALYPRHTAKAAAVKAWDKLKPDRELCDVMADAIRAQMKTEQWKDPQHIPHPSTWLNGARWLDETGSENSEEDSWFR